MSRPRLLVGWIILASFTPAGSRAQDVIPPREGLGPASARIAAAFERELRDKAVPAGSIALVEGPRVVWAAGFGLARPKDGVRASAETIYRAGAISKLVTGLAAMRLVDQGKLDLDARIEDYLPDFEPRGRLGIPITLRLLLSHRSGLCREPPIGNSFEDRSPSLAETVASLKGTGLRFTPGSETAYSNAGIAVVGRIVEVVSGEPFAAAVRRLVIEPIGLRSTGFEPEIGTRPAMARGLMWTYDGRTLDAPTFPLGAWPPGNLYASAPDLGQFVAALFEGDRLVRPETLEEIWKPQGGGSAFGLGFALSEFEGTRRVGHDGSVYGFASSLSALPDEKLGVVVCLSKDGAIGLASRIADLALGELLSAKRGKAPPVFEISTALATGVGRRLEGRYGQGEPALDLWVGRDRVCLIGPGTSFRRDLRGLGDALVADDAFGFGPRIVPGDASIQLQGARLDRLEDEKPGPILDGWRGLIGEYGWPHSTLYILERRGRLFALIDWHLFEPLEPTDPDQFQFSAGGLYTGESVRFTRDDSGRATEVVAANVRFPRRKIDGDDGSTFRIKTVRPVAELRPEALAAKPPAEKGEFLAGDLVDLTTLDPGIRLDIRYASDNNFAGTPFYASARAFLQRPAAEAVVRAHQSLNARGYGLLIHDAYRPWYVTRMFWDATPESGHAFVADPSKGSKHNRGCAVDLTLYHLDSGKAAQMVGGYDEFSDRSSPEYPGGTSLQRWQRDLLRRAMEAQGFAVNEVEWWHFDYRDWPRYPILNSTFEQIDSASKPR